MKKRTIMILILSMFSLLIIGCGGNEGEDTRQFIDTMGVVFTNNADDVINELYVFPIAIDGTAILEQDMGPDLIRNTGNTRRVGSFGVTIEMVDSSYNVMARGRQKDIYVFGNVPLSNVCEAILSYNKENDERPVLTIKHRNGSEDIIEGVHIYPGDAPDHAHMPMRRSASIRFNITNHSDNDISFISMREANDPDKGEVELFIGTLEVNKSTPVNFRLDEEDQEVTDWLLYIQMADGDSMQFNDTFNPWEVSLIEIFDDGDSMSYTVSE